MSFSDFLEDEILDHILGNSAYSAPATVWVALSTTTPNDDGTNFTEPVGGSYVRAEVTNNLTEWSAAAGGSKSNANTIAFVQATASWGLVTYFGIYDALSGGNLLFWAALTASKTVDSGDLIAFGSTKLIVTLD